VSTYHYPEGHLFYRKLHRNYPKIVRGEGCYLYDEDGKTYLDAVGGAYVANIGHGVAAIGEAMARQAGQVAYVNGMAFTNEPAERMAAELAARSPGDLDKVSADEIMKLLDRLNTEFKKTIIMVTHDPRAAERAHLVRHLDKGELS